MRANNDFLFSCMEEVFFSPLFDDTAIGFFSQTHQCQKGSRRFKERVLNRIKEGREVKESQRFGHDRIKTDGRVNESYSQPTNMQLRYVGYKYK